MEMAALDSVRFFYSLRPNAFFLPQRQQQLEQLEPERPYVNVLNITSHVSFTFTIKLLSFLCIFFISVFLSLFLSLSLCVSFHASIRDQNVDW